MRTTSKSMNRTCCFLTQASRGTGLNFSVSAMAPWHQKSKRGRREEGQRGSRCSSSSSSNCNSNSCDAFTERQVVQGSEEGPLKGLTVAIKDIMDMDGFTTGFGHPMWLQTHSPASGNAPTVQRLLDSGATILGRTHMDELAWSLFGVNYHYGTPPNPAAPGKIPGGSSSGSASAVADQTVDIGIGTDTGGSVRIPASYCGIYGIRPTQGAVSLEGARALAPSFDTLGWFARNMDLMAKVGDVLLDHPSPSNKKKLSTWLVASDAFKLADETVQESIYNVVSQSKEELAMCIGSSEPKEVLLDKYNTNFDEWFKAFRVLQSREVWVNLGEWVTEHKPTFGPGIKERFEYAQTIQDEEMEEANRVRRDLRAHMMQVMGEGGVLMLPTAPGPPPTSEESPEVVTDIRARILRLTSIAGLTGFPQVNIPIGEIQGEGPIGLSIMGPPGSDRELLDISTKIDYILQRRR